MSSTRLQDFLLGRRDLRHIAAEIRDRESRRSWSHGSSAADALCTTDLLTTPAAISPSAAYGLFPPSGSSPSPPHPPTLLPARKNRVYLASMGVSLTVPVRFPAETVHDWHSRFASENGYALHQLVSRTPGRIVVFTLDADARTAKVAIRTPLNLEVIIPAKLAAAIDPNKALVLSYEAGRLVTSEIEIVIDDDDYLPH